MIIIKPIRLEANEYVFLPIFNYLFTGYQVSIPRLNHTGLLLINNNGNELLESSLLFKMPFNGFYIIPSILLLFEKNYDLFKKYTIIHLFVIFTPLIIFLLGVNNNFLLNGDFTKMITIFFSLIVTTIIFTQKNQGLKYE